MHQRRAQFFLRLHLLWEWERSGHRLPSGSPKGGATATSTNCRVAASARPALRHRKTPRDRRRFGRRGVECGETDCRRQPEGQAKRSQPGARRGARSAGRANQTMEPINVPPHAIWRDDFEQFSQDRWTEYEAAWDCHGAITQTAKPHRRWLRRRHTPWSSTSATDAASFSIRPTRFLRRTGRSSTRTETERGPRHVVGNPLDFETEIKREREPMPGGLDFSPY